MYNRIKQNESDIIDFSLSILMQAKSKASSGNLEIQDIDTEIVETISFSFVPNSVPTKFLAFMQQGIFKLVKLPVKNAK